MVTFGTLMKSVLVAIVLVALTGTGSADEKLASCCTTVTNKEIKDPILGYLVQERNLPCVRAIIFQTENGLFCCQIRAPWVRRKIVAFEMQKRKAASTPSTVPSSPPSLLSLITSTSSPPSSAPSSSPPPSLLSLITSTSSPPSSTPSSSSPSFFSQSTRPIEDASTQQADQ